MPAGAFPPRLPHLPGRGCPLHSAAGQGQVRHVPRGADKQLRDALCDFAGDSRRASPWATALCDKAIARGCDHPHAVRILARARAHIIWRCWQDNQPYDPGSHNSLQALLRQAPPAAA
jgi:transposase